MLAPYRRRIMIGLGVLGVVFLSGLTYLYVSYGRIIDARLHGERDRAVPRVFARPLTLQTGQNLSQAGHECRDPFGFPLAKLGHVNVDRDV